MATSIEQNQHSRTPKEFGQLLKDIIETRRSLDKISVFLASKGKGSQLVLPSSAGKYSGDFVFTKKDVKECYSQLDSDIKDLKKVFIHSKKKKVQGRKIAPESFSGVYIQQKAGEAIRNFVSQDKKKLFGRVDPDDKKSAYLLDVLPMLTQNGLIMRSSMITLFHAYANAQGLKPAEDHTYIFRDSNFNESFGGTIPAEYYYYDTEDGKRSKHAMVDREDGSSLNTFDTVLETSPPNTVFHQDAAYFPSCFFQSLSSCNFTPRDSMSDEDKAYVNQDDVRAAMLEEHNIIHEFGLKWKKREPLVSRDLPSLDKIYLVEKQQKKARNQQKKLQNK